MEDSGSGLIAWNSVLGAALKIPGVRINRAAFLRSTLSPHVSAEAVEAAVDKTPSKGWDPARNALTARQKLHQMAPSGR
jgi:hypothetical protein